ncbi:MAG: phosphatidylglycerophosphatase A [Candidatus Fonsibacter sp.]|nr:phosphatidylglycerophosphatase A [Candidatus Fonsibacter sp.]
MINFNKKIFTLFGVGFLPISGTAASFITIIIYYLFYKYFNIIFFTFFITFVIFYSLYFLNDTLNKSFSTSDPKEIVIDEFIGQSIPMILCQDNLFLMILSFLLFRLFDITKPWPASYYDLKVKNASGVIMDDVIAGIYTFIIVYLWI